MLLAIKDKSKGILGYVVIGLITIPFTLWGIQSYLGDDSPLFVASVNDSEISTQEFNQVLSRTRQNLQKKYDGKIPFDEIVIKQQVVDQLINQRLLEDVSYSNGYRISDIVLSSRINQTESFHRDGVFDKDYYTAVLASVGQSSTQFEDNLRREMQVNQLQYSILNSGFATEKEVKKYTDLDQQTRDFSYAIFNPANMPTDADITDEDIKQYYSSNSAQFMDPEKVKIEYIEVKSKDYLSDIRIDEAKIREMYDAYVADISHNEERRARHILLTLSEGEESSLVRERLEEIRNKIINGESFEALAEEYSKDPGSAQLGGDLDWIGRDQMVKPFETALYSLNKGDVSEIVETQFGYHIIKLEDVRSPKALTFAEKRQSIEDDLKKDFVDDKFYEVTENLAALAYENVDNLTVASEVLGLQIKTSEFFTQQSGQGVARHDAVRDAAYSESVLSNGENSEIIELADGQVIVLRVLDRIQAKLKPLDSVTAQIRGLLVKRNSMEAVSNAINAAKSKIMAGSTIDEAVPTGIKIERKTLVKRQDADKVSSKILETGFKMTLSNNAQKSVEVVSGLADGMALVVLDKINTVDTKDKTLLASNKKLISNVYSNKDFNAMLAAITSNAKIVRNTKILEE